MATSPQQKLSPGKPCDLNNQLKASHSTATQPRTTAASFIATYYAANFATIERMQIGKVMLIVIALCLVAVLSNKTGHLLWSRMLFKPRIYWIETSGTYQTSKIAIGNQFKANTQSSSTLTRVETVRVWVTDIVSVAFGKDGHRSIIAMASGDSVAKSMADRLIAFAAEQSSITVPTAIRDVERAKSISALDSTVRGAFVGTQLGKLIVQHCMGRSTLRRICLVLLHAGGAG